MDIARTYRTANQFRKLLRAERRTGPSFDLSPRRRLWLYRRGFLSKSGVLYDFESNNPDAYLSDHQRFVGTKRINGHWNALIDNKLAFHRVLGEFPDHRPAVYGLLADGRFHTFDPAYERAALTDGGIELEHPTESAEAATRRPTEDPIAWLDDTLADGEQLVLKWFSGGGGNNVHFLERTTGGEDGGDGEYLFDGAPIGERELAETLADLDHYLVCEHVDQADYAADMFPETANTIRVLTMYDEREGEAFVPIAIHRIGTDESVPVDNFSNGGLTALVDRETGRLSAGAEYPHDGVVDWHESHPDTGTRIEGTAVPGWEQIRERLLEIAETLSHVPYVGWDLVVTDEGEFRIIEANSYPGVASLQVHRPLLTDARTRRFYRDHGVL
ncbi:sugar-transfer associated ATP-grasp domain-containing protein [Natrinema salifodinae]|uniref:Sugar-transfer associated ATP-grasp n=1 Tax=Natrinema salifodinae TaxID=1202768 RepID=A0A1I0MFW9_9EURY|nr:sugar-transfer associated ATP-grasp domain-containing protein [Natrinema salifodinae]SEV87273.1 Sugar-transfer associated ATP-grasp [Natrinema salifodinae]